MNDINQVLNAIFRMKNAGKDPNAILQMILQANPQARNMMTTLQNMANGKSPKEFFEQLARQRGVTEQNISAISNMF